MARGVDLPAKDSRTWAGTVLAALALQETAKFESTRQARRHITRAIERVARQPGNTPAISRTCYVHSAVPEAHLDGVTARTLPERTERRIGASVRRLSAEEGAVFGLLQQRRAA